MLSELATPGEGQSCKRWPSGERGWLVGSDRRTRNRISRNHRLTIQGWQLSAPILSTGKATKQECQEGGANVGRVPARVPWLCVEPADVRGRREWIGPGVGEGDRERTPSACRVPEFPIAESPDSRTPNPRTPELPKFKPPTQGQTPRDGSKD